MYLLISIKMVMVMRSGAWRLRPNAGTACTFRRQDFPRYPADRRQKFINFKLGSRLFLLALWKQKKRFS
ncbi:hypothetical protein PB2503_03432 [Parvularcula bermudensis HTCC2503]|uniref:Uncharacterized protein n=1 Tax=Parvularcula bermudensis (strain ATCC BAA-594 / HTCC2503 / KCTC 12087) TaxID=314260 RepID=E0TDK7_PARBH|nr:hypothetical protein PB2503_03432 [Parvularcula bermudensis HTCC2503]